MEEGKRGGTTTELQPQVKKAGQRVQGVFNLILREGRNLNPAREYKKGQCREPLTLREKRTPR